MLGEAFDPAVPVFDGQGAGTALTPGVAVVGNVM